MEGATLSTPKDLGRESACPASADHRFGNAFPRMRKKSFAALWLVSNTSAWLSTVDESPVARFATQENPATSISSARAWMTSSTVDIPTASAPRFCSIRASAARSEEHTTELQSRRDLGCRLLLEE